MANVFVITFLLSILLLFIGLVAPQNITKHLPERFRTDMGRKGYGILFASLAFISMMAGGSLAPSTQNAATKAGIPTTQSSTTQTLPQQQQHTVVVSHRTVTETKTLPFESTTVEDTSLTKGTSKVITAGVNGLETITYDVTFTDNIETNRQLVTDSVTTPSVTQITAIGTNEVTEYTSPSPSCTNGSYINSAGNRVCNPESSSSVPAGATAQCVDGTYSFSQSRSGTCSHHGGVSTWL